MRPWNQLATYDSTWQLRDPVTPRCSWTRLQHQWFVSLLLCYIYAVSFVGVFFNVIHYCIMQTIGGPTQHLSQTKQLVCFFTTMLHLCSEFCRGFLQCYWNIQLLLLFSIHLTSIGTPAFYCYLLSAVHSFNCVTSSVFLENLFLRSLLTEYNCSVICLWPLSNKFFGRYCVNMNC